MTVYVCILEVCFIMHSMECTSRFCFVCITRCSLMTVGLEVFKSQGINLGNDLYIGVGNIKQIKHGRNGWRMIHP